jgi:uncharacterized membrane protein (DUF2068 family)
MTKGKENKTISKKRLLNILTFFDEKRIGKFVAKYIFKNNIYTTFYWAYISLVLVSFGFFQILRSNPLYELRLWVLAIVGSFIAVLLPVHIVHEIIRSRLVNTAGQAKINYLWSWKNMMLKVKYNQLNNTTKEDLIRVNIIPFLLFSVLPLLFSFFMADYIQLFLVSLSFFHGIYSIKAFALLSFLKRKRKKSLANVALNSQVNFLNETEK